ncbi:MAG: FTR1 family protein [Alphaproteobacteria bacterium]|nr:FTR1 family protein [Alphaproteobacteria bacterium]
MLATLIVVFREVLEAALIVSILMAASKGIAGRGRWIGSGIVAGILGAVLVALFANRIAAAVSGAGEELFNAGILSAAVLMLAWHNIWMTSHGRQLAQHVNAVGKDVASGVRPHYALAVVAGVAVLREGSETVLFVYSILASNTEGLVPMLLGALIGLIAAFALGVGLYFGLLRIPLKRLFTVLGWMVLLLAAGLAAQAAGFLLQAGLLPALGSHVWNTSWLLTEQSIPGRVLHTLIGYESRPAGVQVLAYLFTLAVIGAGMKMANGRGTKA